MSNSMQGSASLSVSGNFDICEYLSHSSNGTIQVPTHHVFLSFIPSVSAAVTFSISWLLSSVTALSSPSSIGYVAEVCRLASQSILLQGMFATAMQPATPCTLLHGLSTSISVRPQTFPFRL